LVLGQTEIDLRYVEHLIEKRQLEICGRILKQIKDRQNGELDSITRYNKGNLALPRYQDILAVLNRLP
jgi:hypothetical protein